MTPAREAAAFPIAWHNSKLDGVTARVSTIDLHGFQAYMTLGHTRARYFAPETGGLIPLGGFAGGVFRIDHDQAYQQTAVIRYQRPHNAEWVDFTWRYDSGLVVSGVPDVEAALALTAAQQVAIGFSCNGAFATYGNPITAAKASIKASARSGFDAALGHLLFRFNSNLPARGYFIPDRAELRYRALVERAANVALLEPLPVVALRHKLERREPEE